MGFIIFLIVIAALYVWFKKTHYNDSPWVKNRIKGRTPLQQATIRYFCNEPSCLSKKPMTDAEYEQALQGVLNSIDFKKNALKELNIEEEEVKEAEPIHFEGYMYDKGALFKKCDDGYWRSSKYQVTWIFFGKAQLFVYQYYFFMDEDGRKHRTEEYAYKDVTSLAITSEREEIPQADPKNPGKDILVNVDYDSFTIKVYGEKFECAIHKDDKSERAIQGMKALLRDKKNS